MQKQTLAQRSKLASASNPTVLFVEFGFTPDEAEMMISGSTIEQAYQRLGGIWKVGNVEYPQAISKEHAQKLHVWNFGEVERTRFVRTDEQGLTWVIA